MPAIPAEGLFESILTKTDESAVPLRSLAGVRVVEVRVVEVRVVELDRRVAWVVATRRRRDVRRSA